jgi:YD repeat-containing protein
MASFGYDDNGNLTSVASPNEQTGQLYSGLSSITAYDERNRPMSVTDALNNKTSLMYDAGGRKASVTRANTQVTTFDRYDAMNRLLQQTVQQVPDPNAVTKWTYYASGLLQTMQDPHLVETQSNYAYTYGYDLMGRKNSLTYPPDWTGAQTQEIWQYDGVGRLGTFTSRATKHETFTYDNLNRLTDAQWDDNQLTPDVHNDYDIASRLIRIRNANAIISRVLFNDGLLNTETTTYADNAPRTVTYTYDSDGNRATIQYPNGVYSFSYDYTGRNQLQDIVNTAINANVAHYVYDPDGNLTTRNVSENSTSSTFVPDALDRVTHIAHALNGTTRTLDYAYDSVGNRKWVKRDNNKGDVFGYEPTPTTFLTCLRPSIMMQMATEPHFRLTDQPTRTLSITIR